MKQIVSWKFQWINSFLKEWNAPNSLKYKMNISFCRVVRPIGTNLQLFSENLKWKASFLILLIKPSKNISSDWLGVGLLNAQLKYHLYFNIQRRAKYSLAMGQVWDVTSHKCQIHADLKHYFCKSLFAMDRWRYKQFLDVPLIIVFFWIELNSFISIPW